MPFARRGGRHAHRFAVDDPLDAGILILQPKYEGAWDGSDDEVAVFFLERVERLQVVLRVEARSWFQASLAL